MTSFAPRTTERNCCGCGTDRSRPRVHRRRTAARWSWPCAASLSRREHSAADCKNAQVSFETLGCAANTVHEQNFSTTSVNSDTQGFVCVCVCMFVPVQGVVNLVVVRHGEERVALATHTASLCGIRSGRLSLQLQSATKTHSNMRRQNLEHDSEIQHQL